MAHVDIVQTQKKAVNAQYYRYGREQRGEAETDYASLFRLRIES